MNIQIFHFCFYCQPLIEQKQKAMKNYNNIKSISTLLLITLLMFGSKKVNAQTRLNNKHTVSFGTGLISTAGMNYYSNLSQNEDFVAEISGGIHFKYEYHLSEKFSLGISLGYVEVKGEWKGDENVYIYQWGPNLPDPNPGNFSFNSTSFVGRFNWSLVKKEKVEIYVGAWTGYRIDSYSENVINSEEYGVDENEVGPPLSIEASFGIRYFITSNFGLYSEIGLAKSFVRGGIVVGF